MFFILELGNHLFLVRSYYVYTNDTLFLYGYIEAHFDISWAFSVLTETIKNAINIQIVLKQGIWERLKFLHLDGTTQKVLEYLCVQVITGFECSHN